MTLPPMVILAVALGLMPGVSGVGADDALDVELAVLSARLALVRDLTADFTEQKFTALLKKPLTSRGRVAMKPPRMRWDTDAPHPSTLTVDEKEVRILYPERKIVEVYPLGEQLNVPAMSPMPRLEELREHFTLSRLPPAGLDPNTPPESHLAVRLTPRDRSLAEHVQRVDVWIDRATGLASCVELGSPDGDRTVITFRNITTNVGLVEEDVTLKITPDIQVVHPLGKGKREGRSSRSGGP